MAEAVPFSASFIACMATSSEQTSLSCGGRSQQARERRPSGSTHPVGMRSELVRYRARESRGAYMWKLSATSARLPTAVPTPSSSRRKAVSTAGGGELAVSAGQRKVQSIRGSALLASSSFSLNPRLLMVKNCARNGKKTREMGGALRMLPCECRKAARWSWSSVA